VVVASAGPYAPCSKQITTPAPHQSIFTGRMLFLMPNQQCQSTEEFSKQKETINTDVSIGQPRLSIARASSVILSHLDIHSTDSSGQLALTSATVTSVTLCQFTQHKKTLILHNNTVLLLLLLLLQDYYHTTTPQPFYGPFSGTTWVSRCQKRTSGLYGARED